MFCCPRLAWPPRSTPSGPAWPTFYNVNPRTAPLGEEVTKFESGILAEDVFYLVTGLSALPGGSTQIYHSTLFIKFNCISQKLLWPAAAAMMNCCNPSPSGRPPCRDCAVSWPGALAALQPSKVQLKLLPPLTPRISCLTICLNEVRPSSNVKTKTRHISFRVVSKELKISSFFYLLFSTISLKFLSSVAVYGKFVFTALPMDHIVYY